MRIAIIGAGYVGLTTGVCLASIGHRVICVDRVVERVQTVKRGQVPFFEPGLPEMLSTELASGRFDATTDLARAVAESAVTFVTVGTPQTNADIDLSQVIEVTRQIGSALRRVSDYHVVAIKSTVVPGTTDTLVRNILEETCGKSAGEFGLCMNPEFLQEGSAVEDLMNPDRIVIGQWDEKSGQVLAEMYAPFNCPKIFTTLRNAEMIKYASNTLLATLISFSNEIAELCEQMPGTDVEMVMQGVHLDRRLSPVVNGERVSPGILKFLRAGSGFGGSCLPKDVNALRAFARKHNIAPHLLDAVATINTARPAYLVRLVEQSIGSLTGATIAVLGLAFKPGTGDARASPALAVIRLLLDKGATIKAFDPMVGTLPASWNVGKHIVVCHSIEDTLNGADATVIVTAWPEFVKQDWTILCGKMRRPNIIDGRNVLSSIAFPQGTNYLRIGQSPDKDRN